MVSELIQHDLRCDRRSGSWRFVFPTTYVQDLHTPSNLRTGLTANLHLTPPSHERTLRRRLGRMVCAVVPFHSCDLPCNRYKNWTNAERRTQQVNYQQHLRFRPLLLPPVVTRCGATNDGSRHRWTLTVNAGIPATAPGWTTSIFTRSPTYTQLSLMTRR